MEKYLSVFRTSPFFAAMTDEEIIAILGCLKAGVLTYKRGRLYFARWHLYAMDGHGA